MCSPDVGAVGLEGVGLGAQLHKLHPPCSPLFPRPGRLAPARLSASFSSQQSRAPMHRAPAARASKQPGALQCRCCSNEEEVGECLSGIARVN